MHRGSHVSQAGPALAAMFPVQLSAWHCPPSSPSPLAERVRAQRRLRACADSGQVRHTQRHRHRSRGAEPRLPSNAGSRGSRRRRPHVPPAARAAAAGAAAGRRGRSSSGGELAQQVTTLASCMYPRLTDPAIFDYQLSKLAATCPSWLMVEQPPRLHSHGDHQAAAPLVAQMRTLYAERACFLVTHAHGSCPVS